MYHIVNDATSEVMSYVPEIWQSFHDRFSGSDEFSVADIDGYAQLISEASGAYALPPIDSINNPNIRSYYTQNRVRKEGNYVFGRGAAYYRQYIPELKGNFSAQLDMVEGEIRDAIDTLESSVPSSEAEHLAVLGVEDNLRGNFLATYLSAINVMRDDPLSTNIDTIIRLSEQLRSGYQRALELQYSHMLGLPYDRHELIRAIREEVSVLAEYRQVYSNASIHPKFKSPEIDDPLVIAARANYLCDQYPETDSLVGLTSGGVELSEVARLLYGVRGKLVSSVHYPISVHNGQTMWSKDKTPGGNQTAIDQIIDIESLAGKHVVVCEDNSNSGQTLARVVDRINSYDAASVHFAVVEIDPTRIIMHFVQQKAGAKHHIGEAADRVRPIANYHHPDFRGAVRIVKMVPQDNSMTKLIAQDTANRGII
jgi:hypoxanthine phosphoribosyltransferase